MAIDKPPLPPSATPLGFSLLGLASAFAAVIGIKWFSPELPLFEATLCVLLAAALPPVMAELIFLRTTPEIRNEPNVSFAAIARKCLGLYATFAFFALLYVIIPEYRGSFYDEYFKLVSLAFPLLAVLAPFYFRWCMRRIDAAWDAYDEMAALVCLEWRGRDWVAIGRHLRNWLVKAFFLPLMFTYSLESVHGLLTFDAANLVSLADLFRFLIQATFFADLLFATVGYMLTFRALNSHIRSSDPSFRGWVVAIACYAPFWQGLLYAQYFAYQGQFDWIARFEGAWFFPLWGAAVVALLVIYSTATLCLGIRFSNLTYRGLAANGPYRFTKHPAYVAKNLSWWLMAVPFLSSENWLENLRLCALLFGINIIYYIRAVTEEKHLSAYPEYVQYALAMNQRSLFRPLVKYLPFLKYQAPTT